MTLIFVVPGIAYWLVLWGRAGASPYRCLYGDAACSLTVATWLLCIVTGLAFLAAYKAARWALRTYDVAFETLQMEQSRVLAERPTETTPRKATRPTNPDRRKSVAEPPTRVHQAHVKFRDGTLELGEPDLDEQLSFEPEDCEFDSLGRAALLDVSACLRVCFRDVARKDVTLRVPLGNLRSDEAMWVRVWIEQHSLMMIRTFGWDDVDASSTVDGRLRTLLFRALKQRPTRAAAVFPMHTQVPSQTQPNGINTTPVAVSSPEPEPDKPAQAAPVVVVEAAASEDDGSAAEAEAAALSLAVSPPMPQKGHATPARQTIVPGAVADEDAGDIPAETPLHPVSGHDAVSTTTPTNGDEK